MRENPGKFFANILFGALAVAMTFFDGIGAISIFAAAIGSLVIAPATSIMLFGLSLLLIGIGILSTILGIWVVKKVIPPMIRWFVKLVRKPFEKKEEV